MIILEPTHDIKTTVLRGNLDESEAMSMVEQKKTTPFRSVLSKPKKEQVHVHSLNLYYECIMAISGKYTADYYRKATHTISVDHKVTEIVLGDHTFQTRPKSGIARSLSRKRGKNKIDLELEEHVFIEEQDQIYIDHHGQEVQFQHKINSKTAESYPEKILEQGGKSIKRPEITCDAALDMLRSRLEMSVEDDVRDLTDEFVLQEFSEVYIPIFEARLTGPKKKVRILRIDSVLKKVI